MPDQRDLSRGRRTGRAGSLRELNAELAKAWPVITVRKDALPDAKDWEGKTDKLPLLER